MNKMAAKGRLLNNSLPGNWNQKGGKGGPGPGIESLFLQISHRIRFRLPPSSEPLAPSPPPPSWELTSRGGSSFPCWRYFSDAERCLLTEPQIDCKQEQLMRRVGN